jgi:hypothetical protein
MSYSVTTNSPDRCVTWGEACDRREIKATVTVPAALPPVPTSLDFPIGTVLKTTDGIAYTAPVVGDIGNAATLGWGVVVVEPALIAGETYPIAKQITLALNEGIYTNRLVWPVAFTGGNKAAAEAALGAAGFDLKTIYA